MLIKVILRCGLCYVYSFMLSWWSTQWYEVYQDPEGTRTLERTTDHIDAPNNKYNHAVNGTDNNFYKGRITTLNEEIIGLNKTIKSLTDELTMVGSLCQLFYSLCLTRLPLFSLKVVKLEQQQ